MSCEKTKSISSLEPMVVDLDGTLIHTDLLFESLTRVVFDKPWIIFLLPIWLRSGITHLKKELASRAKIDFEKFPYNKDLIGYLQQQADRGRTIVLCTGSWYSMAKGVSEQYCFIDSYYGTNSAINLTGSNKADFLLQMFGENNFIYVGNDKKDLEVWKYSSSAVIVAGKNSKLIERARSICKIEKIFEPPKFSIKTISRGIRVHQWLKNILILVPLAASHQFSNLYVFIHALLAFLAFSLAASATYLINDLADLESDRKHRTKSQRPIASGILRIDYSFVIIAFLFCLSLAISSFLPPFFLLSLLIYICITITYSFKLKKLQTIDIVTLASLYTLRIFAGGAATSIKPSFWLLAFSMFIFFSLAIIKRVSELHKSSSKYDDSDKIPGRGYYLTDMHVLMSLAVSSGVLSIFVFSMYINSEAVMLIYKNPYILWFICPIFGYWIVRILIMASRGEIDEDPIIFTVKDWRSWLAGILILVIAFLASVMPS